MIKPIMLAGTGSDVGKSIIAAAFCRIFRQDGYNPAPFKAQNMALNSFATPEGLEIGRAQAVQAEAAGVPCHTDMNPLLLKPTSDLMAQVVLNGKPIGNQSARTYFRKEGREELRKAVCDAFDRLKQKYNPIVLEGAGSISEINLKDRDLVNLPMARHAGADVILVADIDRGGVFASVYGSVMLLDEDERKMIKGVIINKFRGDIGLFEDGIRLMEERCGIPVLGVVPYYKDIYIEEEDSVALSCKQREAINGKINIAVVLLRHMSNFTDFNLLERDDRVHLYYAAGPDDLKKADIVLIPGTKSTLADLTYLRENGMAQAILQAHRDKKTIMGICGGYQIMGYDIHDPQQIEGNIERMPGLGLLPVSTIMAAEKCTRQRQFRFLDNPDICEGYEIHNGTSRIADPKLGTPFTRIADGEEEGCFVNEHCFGTYMHGILDNKAFIDYLLTPYLEKTEQKGIPDYKQFKEDQYDKLAAHVRAHVDMKRIYEILQ
ncbi:MAG: cobyric acid synthase [Bacteroidales bacterium]